MVTTHSVSTRPDTTTLAAFAAVVLIGGSNVVAVKFSNAELDVLWGAGCRFLTAGLITYLVARLLHIPMPGRAVAWQVVVYGLLSFASYGFAYTALLDLPAAVAATVLASTPLFTLLIAAVERVEPFRWRVLAGGILVMAGIGTLGGGAGGVNVGALLLAVAFVVCIAQATVVAKRFPMGHPISTNALGMIVGAVPLLMLSAIMGDRWALPARAETVAAFGYLVVIGSGALFWLYLLVVRRWTATATSFALVLMPVVAAAGGAALLGEPLGRRFVADAALVGAGVYVGALANRVRQS